MLVTKSTAFLIVDGYVVSFGHSFQCFITCFWFYFLCLCESGMFCSFSGANDIINAADRSFSLSGSSSYLSGSRTILWLWSFLFSGSAFAISMASAAVLSTSLASSSSQPSVSAASSSQSILQGKAAPGARPLKRTRIERPRIDIDDQITEANRVHDLLRKMSQAAKSLKKSQTKAKQRLIKKAARLNPADLERIAVLKRIFSDSVDDAALSATFCQSIQPCAPTRAKGALDMHGTLREMMKGVPGADDVVMGLDATLRPGQDRAEASAPDDRMNAGSCQASSCATVRAHTRSYVHAVDKNRPPSEEESDHAGDLHDHSPMARAD